MLNQLSANVSTIPHHTHPSQLLSTSESQPKPKSVITYLNVIFTCIVRNQSMPIAVITTPVTVIFVCIVRYQPTSRAGIERSTQSFPLFTPRYQSTSEVEITFLTLLPSLHSQTSTSVLSRPRTFVLATHCVPTLTEASPVLLQMNLVTASCDQTFRLNTHKNNV